ncbi:MAG: protein kinase [Myxococcales bacterium]|nr:protein kinase [Myxococcales bacterium]
MSTAEDEDLARWKARVGGSIRGKWKLDALLGVGGMAAVYAATHKIGRRDAIKILHPEVAVSRELRARFEQEALAVGKLGHPGAVQVIDIDVTEDGAPFLVMELLEGENLGQRAHRLGGMAEEELFGYADQLLDVLVAAHVLGIVHRDIKPDNLFVTKEGRLKVLDFGIARMKAGGSGLKTRTGAMMGTTSYMAPEQIHGRDVDGRADVFAVGATLFRVLAKRKLHEAVSDADLLVKMGSTQAPPIQSVAPSVSVRAARIIDRALAFDADRRYPDAATMRADVQAVLRGEDPPFASVQAVRAESATRAEGLGVQHALPGPSVAHAMPREPTGVTQSALGAASPLAPTAAPAFDVRPAVAAVTMGAVEPTGLPVVIPQDSSAAGRRTEEKRPPIAVFIAMGAAMLVLGVGVGAWLMLGGAGRSVEGRTAAARVEQGEVDDAEDDPQASASAEEPAPSEAPSASGTATASGAPTAGPTGGPRPRPAPTTQPAPTMQPAPTTTTTTQPLPRPEPNGGEPGKKGGKKGKKGGKHK